jgi:DMSO reductase anchor subunit
MNALYLKKIPASSALLREGISGMLYALAAGIFFFCEMSAEDELNGKKK